KEQVVEERLRFLNAFAEIVWAVGPRRLGIFGITYWPNYTIEEKLDKIRDVLVKHQRYPRLFEILNSRDLNDNDKLQKIESVLGKYRIPMLQASLSRLVSAQTKLRAIRQVLSNHDRQVAQVNGNIPPYQLILRVLYRDLEGFLNPLGLTTDPAKASPDMSLLERELGAGMTQIREGIERQSQKGQTEEFLERQFDPSFKRDILRNLTTYLTETMPMSRHTHPPGNMNFRSEVRSLRDWSEGLSYWLGYQGRLGAALKELNDVLTEEFNWEDNKKEDVGMGLLQVARRKSGLLADRDAVKKARQWFDDFAVRLRKEAWLNTAVRLRMIEQAIRDVKSMGRYSILEALYHRWSWIRPFFKFVVPPLARRFEIAPELSWYERSAVITALRILWERHIYFARRKQEIPDQYGLTDTERNVYNRLTGYDVNVEEAYRGWRWILKQILKILWFFDRNVRIPKRIKAYEIPPTFMPIPAEADTHTKFGGMPVRLPIGDDFHRAGDFHELGIPEFSDRRVEIQGVNHPVGGYDGRSNILVPAAQASILNYTTASREAYWGLIDMSRDRQLFDEDYGFWDSTGWDEDGSYYTRYFTADNKSDLIDYANAVTSGKIQGYFMGHPIFKNARSILDKLKNQLREFENLPEKLPLNREPLTDQEKAELVEIARREWAWWDAVTTIRDQDGNITGFTLPPDHTQGGVTVRADYVGLSALGFYAMAIVAARELDFIDRKEASERLKDLVDKLNEMKKKDIGALVDRLFENKKHKEAPETIAALAYDRIKDLVARFFMTQPAYRNERELAVESAERMIRAWSGLDQGMSKKDLLQAFQDGQTGKGYVQALQNELLNLPDIPELLVQWHYCVSLKPLETKQSTVDLGWLLAGLMVAQQYLEGQPALKIGQEIPAAREIERFIKGIPLEHVYDVNAHQFFVSRDSLTAKQSKEHYELFATENLPTVLIAIGKGDLTKAEGLKEKDRAEEPRQAWDKLKKTLIEIRLISSDKRSSKKVKTLASTGGSALERRWPWKVIAPESFPHGLQRFAESEVYLSKSYFQRRSEIRLPVSASLRTEPVTKKMNVRSEMRTSEVLPVRERLIQSGSILTKFLGRDVPMQDMTPEQMYTMLRGVAAEFEGIPRPIRIQSKWGFWRAILFGILVIFNWVPWIKAQRQRLIPKPEFTEREILEAQAAVRRDLPRLLTNPEPGRIYTAADLRPGEDYQTGDMDQLIPYLEGKPVIFGGAGFIGSHVAEALHQDQGAVVVFRRAVDETGKNLIPNLDRIRGSEKIFLLELGDLADETNYPALKKLVKHAGTIYHMAAQPNANVIKFVKGAEPRQIDRDATIEMLDKTIHYNVNLTMRIAKLAKQFHKKMVYGSSAHLYTLVPLLADKDRLIRGLSRTQDEGDRGKTVAQLVAEKKLYPLDVEVVFPKYFSKRAQRFIRTVRFMVNEYESSLARGESVPSFESWMDRLRKRLRIRKDLSALTQDLAYGFYALSKIIP
ncbi:MAG: GDP-mannose 4,6-dehydratase, partial [Candidatus Omnitrophica bacterium]|nr:GDP-mannose 4,6-dehydratase [Candidatus Omnitrophota bacterium]